MSFNEELIKAREKAGISQLRLADDAGTAFQTIVNWEKGDVEPSKLVKIGLSVILKNKELKEGL